MAKKNGPESRPGFMVYFEDCRHILSVLNDREAGTLFRALVAYAESGETADFSNRLLAALFGMCLQKIDADRIRYEELCEARRANANKRWSGKNDDASDDANDANACTCISADAKHANTNTSTNPSTNSNTNSNGKSNAKGSDDTKTGSAANAKERASAGRRKYGAYDNVLLSEDELAKLKEEFPGDYQQRLETLSEYMASTGKHYKSHLATIRSWAKRDLKGKPKQQGYHREAVQLPF